MDRKPPKPWRTPEEASLFLRAILGTVDRLGWLLRAFRVDRAQFRELVRLRVVLTSRAMSRGQAGMGTTGLVLEVLFTGFLGLLTGILAVVVERTETWIVLSQSVLAGMLLLLATQSLAGILFDTTDVEVLSVHPVDDRALLASRLAEIALHLAILVVSFSAGNVLLAAARQPPLAVLLFPLLSLLCGLTVLGGAALGVALCLRVVGPARFQRVTLWTQILVGALFFGGPQLLRLLPRERMGAWIEAHHGVLLVLPPFQYAELFDLLAGRGSSASVGASVGALLVPPLALAATLVLASRSYVAALRGEGVPRRERGRWPDGPLHRLGPRIAPGLQRSGFSLAAALSRREPQFLRSVVPMLVMYQVMILGIGMRDEWGFAVEMSAWALLMMVPGALFQGQSTGNPEAAQLFRGAPLESESEVLRGGVKALLVQWFLVPGLLIGAIQLAIAGPGAFPGILLALELAAAAALAMVPRYRIAIPFTRPPRRAGAGTASFGLVLLAAFCGGIVVALHLLLTLHPIATWSGIVLVGALLPARWRRVDGMRSSEEWRR